ncbi:TPA: Hsp20/alpha crystallin family protein [Candidatus Bipolaricaulota bacterium]|nr:Hsp20/alpha crystallin family protein [Candidatus Bipolaricaulota bacterium]
MKSGFIFSLQRELGLQGLFGREEGWLPPTDVYETEGEFVVCMDLPGMEREGIKISFTEGVLTIRGERRNELKFGASQLRCHQLEIGYGPFRREIYFPVPIDQDRIRAEYRQGLLKVVLPKR